MAIVVGPGIDIGPGINITVASAIGPTTSTATPTIFGGVTTATLTSGSSPVSPFAVNCSSYNLNGSTGYMNLPASTNWAFGTGDFTVEWFQYMTATPSNPRVFSVGNYSAAAVAASIEGGILYVWEASGNRFSSSLTGYTNTWIHFAISRISNQTRVFRNGTQIGSTYTDNNNINNSSSVFAIGQESTATSGSYFPGYITSFRVCKGVGVYSGNFTTPTTLLGQTQSANPYGGANTSAITTGQCVLLLNPLPPPTVEYLVVAGGGGGGIGSNSGGGGGGGFRTASGFAVSSGVALTVTVGAGGLNGQAGRNSGGKGGNSVFSTITATGGGGGIYASAGMAGGSGGGGGVSTFSGGGAAGAGNTPSTTPSQGNNGGASAGNGSTRFSAGGGGGAGAVGETINTTTATRAASGGVGAPSSISGTEIYYAGGGGVGVDNRATALTDGPGFGGNGGGGGGAATSATTGVSGTVNTGGGGGGGAYDGTNSSGGSGGSGIVIIRYEDTYDAAVATTGSPTVTVGGGYRVYKFTQSGTITF